MMTPEIDLEEESPQDARAGRDLLSSLFEAFAAHAAIEIERGRQQRHSHPRIGGGVRRADAEQQPRQQRPCAPGQGGADGQAGTHQPEPIADDHAHHVGGLRPQRDADADLARPLCHELREHAVDPQGAENQPHRAEEPEQHDEKPWPRDRFTDHLALIDLTDGSTIWEYEPDDPRVVVGDPVFSADGTRIFVGLDWEPDEERPDAPPPDARGIVSFDSETGDIVGRVDLGQCGGSTVGGESDLPGRVVNRAVMVPAQEHQIRQRRGAAVDPVADVMGMSHHRRPGAAGEGAVPIASHERGPDRRGDESVGAAHIQRAAVGVQEDADEVAVARHPPHRRGGEVEPVVGHPEPRAAT